MTLHQPHISRAIMDAAVVGDETIRYYAVVGDDGTSTLVHPIQQQFLVRDDGLNEELLTQPTTTLNKQPLYVVTVAPDEQIEDNYYNNGGIVKMEEDDDLMQQQLIDASTSATNPFLSNLKLITLNDGRMFVTSDDSDDLDLEIIQQQEQVVINDTPINANLVDDADDDDEEQNNQQMAAQDEDSQEMREFRETRLEDGSLAMVDMRLWNDLLENIKNDEELLKKADKKFICPHDDCCREYSSANHLTVHLRTHTGDRPYHCTISGCTKSFSTGYSLKSHIRTHTGEKPYGCQSCDKHFKTAGDLQKHIRTHTGEKPFKCPIEGCGRSFTTSNIRKVHLRSHTGERPYVCKFANCGKAFASATNYKNHVRIHSGEKPYACLVEGCGKRFTEYSSLYKHNGVHKPEKPYQCNICGVQCKQEATLKNHKRSMHNMLITEDGTEITLAPADATSDNQIVLQVSQAGRGGFSRDFFCSDDEEDERLIP